MYLSDKTAVITGVSRGLGLALAKALLAQKVKVFGWGRNAPDLSHPGFKFIDCDVRIEDEVEEAAEATLKASKGKIDILVNNAGLGLFSPIDKMGTEEWFRMIDTNLNGVFFCTRALAGSMRSRKSGHIVNISSVAGKLASAEGSGYSATKFGLSGFSEALFHELRNDGIKVSTVYPGSISTAFFDNVPSIKVHPNMLRVEDVADNIVWLLNTPPNHLISEMVIRPLVSKPS